MLSRRGMITGLISFVAAPAIVRAGSLMPVKAIDLDAMIDEAYRLTRNEISKKLYGDLVEITRKAFVPRLYVQLYSKNPLESFIDMLREDAASELRCG